MSMNIEESTEECSPASPSNILHYETENESVQLASQQSLLMHSLRNFFSNEVYLTKIRTILNGESKMSLRVIDWFVTNYSKKNNVYYVITEDGQMFECNDEVDLSKDYKLFVVFQDYKSQLKGYQKKQFDPFCRRSRIKFYYNATEYFYTTVGQLNFFRWAISNNVLDYIEMNLEDIENDMNHCYKSVYQTSRRVSKTSSNRKKLEDIVDKNLPDLSADTSEESSPMSSQESSSSSRRKRRELSSNGIRTISKFNVPLKPRFD
jgi:hypothetical protein